MSKADFSIITCSIDAGKYSRFETNIAAIFSDRAELIKIYDARSLAEGYPRGAALAKGELLIFCHDDIEILNPDFPQLLEADLQRFDLVGLADLDGDGDIDVLGAASVASHITWWENLTGAGTSWTKHTIDGAFVAAISVHAADVDGDGDLDVLGAAAAAVFDIAW